MDYLKGDNSLETFYRSIILFGANAATYKFALGKSLMDLDIRNTDFISLEELAIPFSKHIVEHVISGKRQTTSRSSKFLYACMLFAEDKISHYQLIDITTKLGFNNVLDAFHNVSGFNGDTRFFHKTVRNGKKGIVLTDELYKLRMESASGNLLDEIEGRWNLVETSWEERRPNMIIHYDQDTDNLFTYKGQTDEQYLNSFLRIPITHVRNPLSGYQKGKCFYCFDDITIEPNQSKTADVDHFFPLSLQHKFTNVDLRLNDVWNLVLACPDCNRGLEHGKWAHTPSRLLLDRLEKRNNYYVYSRHPLGDNIIRVTGDSIQKRRRYLMQMHSVCKEHSSYEWYPKDIKGDSF